MNISGGNHKKALRTPRILFLLLIGALVLTGALFIGACFTPKWYKQGDDNEGKWHGSLWQITSGENTSYSHVARDIKKLRDAYPHGSTGYKDFNRLVEQFEDLNSLAYIILVIEIISDVIIGLQILCVLLVMCGTKSLCLKCIAPTLVVLKMVMSGGLLFALIEVPHLTFGDNCHKFLGKPLRICARTGPILFIVATIVMLFTEIFFIYLIFREVRVLRTPTEKLLPAEPRQP